MRRYVLVLGIIVIALAFYSFYQSYLLISAPCGIIKDGVNGSVTNYIQRIDCPNGYPLWEPIVLVVGVIIALLAFVPKRAVQSHTISKSPIHEPKF